MSRWFQITSSAILIATLSACSRPELDTSEVIRPVRVMEIQSAAASTEESYPAQVEARFNSALSFQVGGQLSKRDVDVGQEVKKGQVLAQLDPKDLKLALRSAQAQLNAAETEYKQTQTDLARAQELKDKGFVSQAQLDRQQLAFDAAQSRLAQARANYRVQANQNRYGSLLAPNDGVITAIYAEVGQVMSPGQPVVQWADQTAVQVKLAVPETRVSFFQEGMMARVKLWSKTEYLPAKVREVSPVADPITRTYQILLDLDAEQQDVRFGMSATVYFDKELSHQKPRVPVSAVVADGLGAFVWVFDESQGVVNKRRIAASEVVKEGVLIDKGLVDGDLVVTAGTHVLNEGQKVKRFIEAEDIQAALEDERSKAQPE